MPRPDPNTLAGAIHYGDRLTAFCRACDHRAELDLHALAARLGPDHSILKPDLAPHLKCAACGSREFTLIRSPDPRPAG